VDMIALKGSLWLDTFKELYSLIMETCLHLFSVKCLFLVLCLRLTKCERVFKHVGVYTVDND
jgi:hypothetical protein